MGVFRKVKVKWFLSLKITAVMIVLLIILGANYYNHHVITYQKQLNVLINYIYDETAPDQVISVYQKFLNMESEYSDRIKRELGPALINRYQYYANLYMLRKIQYEEYLQYEQIIAQLFFSSDDVKETTEDVRKYYQSQRFYTNGTNLQQQGRIEDAIASYIQVMFDDRHYYDLAKGKIEQCIQLIKQQYLTEANEYYENQQYMEAIERLNYLSLYTHDDSINSLKWYYQSEFYVEAMSEVVRLSDLSEYGYAIKYLESIKPYLGAQYQDTINLRLSDITLARAQRRDKMLGKYGPKIQVQPISESNQQIISYNQIALPPSTTFNQVAFASNTFANIKKVLSEDVEANIKADYVNIMPLILANSDITNATLSFMFGYYSENLNDFTEVSLLADGEIAYTYTVEEGQKRQVWLDNQVIEWIMIDIDDETMNDIIKPLLNSQTLSIVFKGKYINHQAEIGAVEKELMTMMIDIYDAIVK
ncbi:MAG: hypothetical protein ACRCST_06625 [Turicibacter sp.]